ncbi:hypothetical protein U27_01797 [Candidatus Vecturithrix granuli]|uniref:Uncharacterized protein n=1 Tax=Vecturithrix granuli TaxID=1499967 RepID=A0A0S6WAM7_VECG1|nr:hypothetical protein U27_01797 [Candidatus Vecturithrix granuli]
MLPMSEAPIALIGNIGNSDRIYASNMSYRIFTVILLYRAQYAE